MRSSQRKWLYAQLYLVWVGFKHVVCRLWPWAKKRPGADVFRLNYCAEGYLPCSAELRAIAHEPGRCTACGLCDVVCPQGLSPMRMLLTNKKPEEDCLSCTACEVACPESILIISYVKLASKTFHSGPSWRQISRT